MDYMSFVWGAVGGVGWSILGFAREKQKNTKIDFDPKQFIKTVIIGAVMGFYAGYSGMTIDVVSTTGFSLTATAIADKIVNLIWGFFKK